MSDLVDWLEARRPRPPPELHERIVHALARGRGRDHGDRSDGGMSRAEAGVAAEGMALLRVDRLVGAARARLDAARARPGRIRESAFELLVADALITYACEAALETEDPSATLEAVSEVGRRQ